MQNNFHHRLLTTAHCSSLQILIKPSQISFVSVALVAWYADAVELTRIDDELRGHAECAQCLVHLLAACGWHIEIFFTAEKKRGVFILSAFNNG